jgi:hypothetical protein
MAPTLLKHALMFREASCSSNHYTATTEALSSRQVVHKSRSLNTPNTVLKQGQDMIHPQYVLTQHSTTQHVVWPSTIYILTTYISISHWQGIKKNSPLVEGF